MSSAAIHPTNHAHPFYPQVTAEAKASSHNPLNRELCIAPQDLMSHHANKEALWNVARAAAVIGFLVLTSAAFVATSVFAPNLVLYVVISVFLATPAAASGFSYADQQVTDHALQKTKYGRIAEIHRDLAALSPHELRSRFAEFGIMRREINDFDNIEGGLPSLTVGLATLLYQCETAQQLFQRHKDALAEIHADPSSKYRTDMMRQTFYLQQALQATRINAAYMQGLLLRPCYQGTLDQIGTMPLLNPENFAMEKLYGNTPNAFVFQDGARDPLKAYDLEIGDTTAYSGRRDLGDLGNRLFAGIA